MTPEQIKRVAQHAEWVEHGDCADATTAAAIRELLKEHGAPPPPPKPLPCPWCGSAPTLHHLAGAATCDPVMWRCCACHDGRRSWHDTVEGATAAWNRRQPCPTCESLRGQRETLSLNLADVQLAADNCHFERDGWKARAEAAELVRDRLQIENEIRNRMRDEAIARAEAAERILANGGCPECGANAKTCRELNTQLQAADRRCAEARKELAVMHEEETATQNRLTEALARAKAAETARDEWYHAAAGEKNARVQAEKRCADAARTLRVSPYFNADWQPYKTMLAILEGTRP